MFIPSEKAYTIIAQSSKTFAVAGTAISLISLAFKVVAYLYGTPGAIRVGSMIPWLLVICLFAASAGALILASRMRDRRNYWYRRVTKGVIVDRNIIEWSTHIPEPGHRVFVREDYRMLVKGKNRRGDIRADWHSVGPRAYKIYGIGDEIDITTCPW